MQKQRWEESERRRAEERRSEKRKSEKKEDAGARKGRKVAKHCVFPMICSSRGSKSRLAKAAGAEPCGQMRWKVARRCRAKHISKSNCTKPQTHQRRTTFGSCDVEKVHAVVARSTFPSQNAENTPCSDHFWKLTCRKIARCGGAKHISKSSVKNWRSRSIFRSWHIEKVHAVVGRSKFRSQEGYGALLDVRLSSCVAGTRDCAPCQKWAKREGFVAVSTTTTTTLHSTSLYCNYNYSYNYNYITLHYITPHYTSFFTPHSTTHRSTPLHNNTLHSITPRYTTLH